MSAVVRALTDVADFLTQHHGDVADFASVNVGPEGGVSVQLARDRGSDEARAGVLMALCAVYSGEVRRCHPRGSAFDHVNLDIVWRGRQIALFTAVARLAAPDLEPAVRAWFADQHPDWTVTVPAGTWQHAERAWQIASPDALLTLPDGTLAGYEGKTSGDDTEWGQDGTDQIPVGYRAQVMWQMDTVGYRRTHVAVLSAWLEFKAYVVDYDQDEADFIRERCAQFLSDVESGNAPPLDSADATYQAVRHLHPAIDGTDHDLAPDLACPVHSWLDRVNSLGGRVAS